MRLGALVGAIAVAVLLAWMLATDGAWRILGLVGRAGGLGIAALALIHFPQLWLSGAAWRAVTGSTTPKVSFGSWLTLRWIREAVNNLLPVAQVGGEFVGARLLHKRGVTLSIALAGAVGDLTVELVTQIAFTLLGLALLLFTAGDSSVARLMTGVLAISLLAATGFIVAQRAGLAHLVEIGMIRIGRMVGWNFGQEPGVHAALIAIYGRPLRLLSAALYHFSSWLIGGIEVYVALHLLGHDVDLTTGMAIESLGQALKSFGFAVPAALGVQEGGYILVCGVYGLSPEVAIALSLMKRLREIVLGVPALAAWQWFEARPASMTTSLPSSGTCRDR
ncbi:MAG: flippase-like domain-containing protein [Hyphomicrobiales bacterium]|nr:flippase-like domain-containing protein [Hyphomicrobiales bacterium]MBV9434095.1 flippase-like domain-containing protein [Hyphomicrobiales bacterium]